MTTKKAHHEDVEAHDAHPAKAHAHAKAEKPSATGDVRQVVWNAHSGTRGVWEVSVQMPDGTLKRYALASDHFAALLASENCATE